VLVSPHRTERPWQGQVEKAAAHSQPVYDPECYLCPGNSRVGGVRNPDYTSTFVFENDFAALRPDTPVDRCDERGLLVAESEPGICRVICFSPRHDLTVSRMEAPALRQVVDTWIAQYQELGALAWINHVQIFENRGAMMGCSNPTRTARSGPTTRCPTSRARNRTRKPRTRAPSTPACFATTWRWSAPPPSASSAATPPLWRWFPFGPVWPFETLLLPVRHSTALDELTATERDDLAGILKRLTTRYDNLFQVSFPYSLGFHQRPTDGQAHPEWHFHAHFYPPLLRSATVRKFLVGYEMLAMPQRDITPEAAAARLREVGEIHAV